MLLSFHMCLLSSVLILLQGLLIKIILREGPVVYIRNLEKKGLYDQCFHVLYVKQARVFMSGFWKCYHCRESDLLCDFPEEKSSGKTPQ